MVYRLLKFYLEFGLRQGLAAGGGGRHGHDHHRGGGEEVVQVHKGQILMFVLLSGVYV